MFMLLLVDNTGGIGGTGGTGEQGEQGKQGKQGGQGEQGEQGGNTHTHRQKHVATLCVCADIKE